MDAAAWYQLASNGCICMLCGMAVPHVLLSKHISTRPDYVKRRPTTTSNTWTQIFKPELVWVSHPCTPNFNVDARRVCVCVCFVFSLWPFPASTLKFRVRGRDAWWPSSRPEFKYWKLLGVVTNEVWQHDVHTFTHARICEHAHTHWGTTSCVCLLNPLLPTKGLFNVPLLGLSGTSRKET